MQTENLTIVPANEATADDLDTIFGARGDPAGCQCQWFKARDFEWKSIPRDELTRRLREQTACGHPESESTSGLVAFLDGEPVGWCAVEPRTAYLRRLERTRIHWAGRTEDRQDSSIWAVTCFVVRKGFRRQGISGALAAATVDFARDRGAKAIEGYPMIVEPGTNITWGELFVGSRSIFVEAGFAEVTHPSPRRVVMRIDF
jgi:GNAT superfamily N-acetyltransferase